MARIDFKVKQSDIDALRMTSTQACLKNTIVEYREFAGCITINTLLDSEGNNYNRRDLARWPTEKLFGTPVIAALCASIKDARELTINLDTYYFKVEIEQEPVPALQLVKPSNPLDKIHLMTTMQLLKGQDSFYRTSRGSIAPVKLDDLDVAGMIQNGGVDEVLVKVSIGSFVSYVPFTAIAAVVPQGGGEAYARALSALVSSLIASAFMQQKQ